MSKAAVYIVRDPRDVVVSFSKHLGVSIDKTIELMGKEDASLVREDTHTHFLGSWSSHVTSWTDERSSISCGCIRFEAIKENPLEAFELIFQGMGLHKHKQVMERIPWAIEECELERLRKQEEEIGFREASQHTKFFNKGAVGGWREVLTAEQAGRIETDHGKVMSAMGYEPEFVTYTEEPKNGPTNKN
jgi:hypothetical protein